ncbi:MAG: TolC family protein [bacterium]|nr:TolC family protein [bacterium]
MINKKSLYIIISILVLFVFSANSSFAIVDKNKKNQPTQTKIYTNDVHLVFTLEDCINIAVAQNPAIRSAVYSEIAQKTKIGQEWSKYFPELSANVYGAAAGNHSSDNEVYYTSPNQKGFVASVSAQMMLFDFGKAKANADREKRTYESKQALTKENINSIIYDIKTTYYNILFAQAQVKVYEDTVKDYELQLKQAWAFYNIGKKAKIDVVIAEYNLGKAKLQLVKAKNTLSVANIELAKIMGIPEYSNFELSGTLPINKYDVTIDDAIATAMDVRPEIISAKKLVDAEKMNARAAKRKFAPDIAAFGGYNYYSEYKLSSGQVGVGLSYSALNIMKIKKEIDEANAKYQKSVADYENTKNNVYFNVKRDYFELTTAEETIKIAKLALDEAKEQYRQVTGRYKAGVGDAIELKDGENTYLNARLDFYNTLLNYNTAAASLEKQIGVPLKPSLSLIINFKK